jgi:hypothetical protein
MIQDDKFSVTSSSFPGLHKGRKPVKAFGFRPTYLGLHSIYCDGSILNFILSKINDPKSVFSNVETSVVLPGAVIYQPKKNSQRDYRHRVYALLPYTL